MVDQTVVFRRRSSRLGNIINSVKNIVDEEGNILATTNAEHQIVAAVDNYTAASNVEVPTGCKIFGIYFSIFMFNDAPQIAGSLNWYFAIRRGGQVFTDFPTPTLTGRSNVRNQILHEEKGIGGSVSNGGGGPMQFQGVIKIPKSYQRLREGDVMFISTRSIQAGKFCIKAIYKFYR